MWINFNDNKKQTNSFIHKNNHLLFLRDLLSEKQFGKINFQLFMILM